MAQIYEKSWIFRIFVLMDNKILKALKQCPLFADMSDMEIEMTLSAARYRIVEYDKKDVFALTGMPCQYVDIVVSGTLICRMVGISGKQVEVSRLTKGDIVAPAFIFAQDNKMPVSVETDTRVSVLRMKPEVFMELMNNDPKLNLNFIRVLSDIDAFLTRKMKVLSLLTVREKVAYFLLEAAGKQGSLTVRIDQSRQEIADSFGIQKYSLLRVLSEMSANKAISIDGKTITILDRSKL